MALGAGLELDYREYDRVRRSFGRLDNNPHER